MDGDQFSIFVFPRCITQHRLSRSLDDNAVSNCSCVELREREEAFHKQRSATATVKENYVETLGKFVMVHRIYLAALEEARRGNA